MLPVRSPLLMSQNHSWITRPAWLSRASVAAFKQWISHRVIVLAWGHRCGGRVNWPFHAARSAGQNGLIVSGRNFHERMDPRGGPLFEERQTTAATLRDPWINRVLSQSIGNKTSNKDKATGGIYSNEWPRETGVRHSWSLSNISVHLSANNGWRYGPNTDASSSWPHKLCVEAWTRLT